MSSSVAERLHRIYPHLSSGELDELAARVCVAAGVPDTSQAAAPNRGFDSDEVVLITYGDTFAAPGRPHLRSLKEFWEEHLASLFSTIHVLPFFPSSGDGGFSIVDYRQIAYDLGTWLDLDDLVDGAGLMVDLVCNHGSSQSEWFADFIADRAPGRDYFMTADPDDDLEVVTRPRTHPLLTPVETTSGVRHVWTTFSPDQVDFDFSNPDVLVEFCEILGFYLSQGATRIRLDAIAYLWKQVGTECVHRPETHEIVKLMRSLVEQRDPRVLLITETNVPHAENVSYFGDGDEAHVVYNFTLAPLIAWSLTTGRGDVTTAWLRELAAPPSGCSFLNFIASHDGIGLRPVEDLISTTELQPLLDAALAVGGDYSAYSTPSGPRPYELNVSLADLLAGADGETPERFVVAHALMLALQGIPAIYVHSMLMSTGDLDAVARTGHKRDINRERVDLESARERISTGWRRDVFAALARVISVRREVRAFAPDSPQRVHDLHPQVVAVERGEGDDVVLALHNMSARPVAVDIPAGFGRYDCVSGQIMANDLVLASYQAVWLGRRP